MGSSGCPPAGLGRRGGLGGSRLREGSALPSAARGAPQLHREPVGAPGGSDGPAAERSPRGDPRVAVGCAGALLGMLIPCPRYPAPRCAADPRPWALTRVFVELPWSGTTALWPPRRTFFIRFLAPCSSVAGDVMRARCLCGVLLPGSWTRMEIPDPGAEAASAICLNGWVLMNLSNPTTALNGGIWPRTPPDAAVGNQNTPERSRARPPAACSEPC